MRIVLITTLVLMASVPIPAFAQEQADQGSESVPFAAQLPDILEIDGEGPVIYVVRKDGTALTAADRSRFDAEITRIGQDCQPNHDFTSYCTCVARLATEALDDGRFGPGMRLMIFAPDQEPAWAARSDFGH